MKLFILIAIVSVNFVLGAQILDNSSGELFSEDPKFNSDFIRNNKVKSIKGYYSTKADYDRIRPTNNVYVYEFNEKGLLVKDYKTHYKDTIVRGYEYNEKNQLIVMRQSDQFGFHSYHYVYDSLNRLISKEYRRDVNKNGSRVDFEIAQSLSVSTERFTYEQTDKHLKKNYFNSLGKLYKYAFFYTDSNGYLFREEMQAVNGNSREQTIYTYNNNGFLKEKTSEKVLGEKITTRIKFEYDQQNNILAQHYYRNGVYKTEFQIVYSSATMLLNALLARDIETNVITILKFSEYQYF
ncbi:MAG: hypothetical protein R3279_02575 [Putridiphycobacter sp.]|nr:hypothetical protein [Putridiphycobacter sp.]